MLPFPDEREVPRPTVDLGATVRELRSVASRCRITDLTRFGCRLADCEVDRGDEVWIHIDGYEAARATIIWTKTREAGCRFYAAPVAIASQRPMMVAMRGAGHPMRRAR